MNLLIAKKVGSSYQKVAVRLDGKPMEGGLPYVAYSLCVNADFYFQDEPAAISFDIVLGGDEFRVSKF